MREIQIDYIRSNDTAVDSASATYTVLSVQGSIVTVATEDGKIRSARKASLAGWTFYRGF